MIAHPQTKRLLSNMFNGQVEYLSIKIKSCCYSYGMFIYYVFDTVNSSKVSSDLLNLLLFKCVYIYGS